MQKKIRALEATEDERDRHFSNSWRCFRGGNPVQLVTCIATQYYTCTFPRLPVPRRICLLGGKWIDVVT